MKIEDVIIIGAGPAGITAAIQLKRYGLMPILLEKERVGGLLWNANLVENYPGFPNGIPGPKLVAVFKKQLQRIGVKVTHDDIVDLDFDGESFHLESGRTSYRARYVIAASGTKARPVPLTYSPEARNKIYSEVYPLLDVHDKQFVIIGAGDAAFDYALNLAKRNVVTILNRGVEVKCMPLLREQTRKLVAVEYYDSTTVSRIETSETAERLRVWCKKGGMMLEYPADYVVFAIGREPCLDFLSSRIRQKRPERLHFVGDVANDLFRQTAIACGDGLRAAMKIYREMSE